MATARFKLQCERLQDLITEQRRLDLIGVEPTSQERDDITSLLSSLRPATGGDNSLRRQYKSLIAQLRDIGFDTEPYELSDPVEGLGPLDPALGGEPPKNEWNQSSSSHENTEPNMSVSRNSKKSVRFSDEPNELHYRDDPDAPVSDDVYDTNEEMLLDQDRRLYTLGESVERQRHIGTDVNSEIRTHIDLLGDLEMQADRSELRLGNATEGVKVINHKMREHGSCLIITCLVLILFILLIVF